MSVPRGEILIRERSASSGCYVLLSGSLRVELEGGEISRTLTPPDVVGEIGPVTGRPRNATVIAAEASKLVFLPVIDLREAMADDPDFVAALRQYMEPRLSRPDRGD